MARTKRLTTIEKREWQAEMRLAAMYQDKIVRPTRKFSDATKRNLDHWTDIAWQYEQVTSNYLFANQQAILPRVLMREPRITVRPVTRLTKAWERVGEDGQTVMDRWVAAALIQQIANWRWREFAFTKQVRRAVRDDYNRGMEIGRAHV